MTSVPTNIGTVIGRKAFALALGLQLDSSKHRASCGKDTEVDVGAIW